MNRRPCLLAAARRVEAAKYSAASMGRDEVIARREATTRGRELAAKKKAVRAAEAGTLRPCLRSFRFLFMHDCVIIEYLVHD